METDLLKPAEAVKRDESTRRLIVKTGIDYMKENGSEALSMVDVAKAANVSRRTVYNHFESKAALIEACEDAMDAVFWAQLSIELEPFDEIDEQLAVIAIFLVESWTRRDHTPWYGFLSADDKATLMGSKYEYYVGKLADYIGPLLEAARTKGQVPATMNVNDGALWAARMVFSFAVGDPKHFKNPVKIVKLFTQFTVNGLAGVTSPR